MSLTAIINDGNVVYASKSDGQSSNGSAVLHRNLHQAPHKVVSASGNYLELVNGQKILDATGGAAVACLGHGNERVKDAIIAQLDEVAYCHSLFFASSGAEGLARELIDSTKGQMSKAFIVSSGSEAMESSMKLARQYFLELSPSQPKRTKFIARKESYHGTTLGSLSMSGHVARRALYEPMLLDNVSRVSACNAYHGMRKSESVQDYVTRLAQELEEEFYRLGPETVCAFVAEPVVGAALGCVPSLPGYFVAMKAVCDNHGALLVLDEVMCGMGRTGTLHAWEQEDVVPDIQTIESSMLWTKEQGKSPTCFVRHANQPSLNFESSFSHGQTYQGHPVACAAALEVQRIIRDESLIGNVQAMGSYLGALLMRRLGDHPHIEFVRDRWTKTSFDPKSGVAMAIHSRGMEPDYGISLYPGTGSVDGTVGDHVIIAPAYNVTSEDIELVVAVTDMKYSDAARSRELYKYFQPSQASEPVQIPPPRQIHDGSLTFLDGTIGATQASSPNTSLTAFAQLCAWRLGAQRAMISLIDHETQWFVAESTRTLSFRDNQKHEDPQDALWLGCASVSKEGRLCEKTIELAPIPGGYACFEVSDLSEDPRFNQLPFVTEGPRFRFYAGTPITSNRGINIGSLFVIDDRVRPEGLKSEQKEFLGTMADTIMQHLQMSREAEERKRAMVMSRGLSAFVEGKGSTSSGGTPRLVSRSTINNNEGETSEWERERSPRSSDYTSEEAGLIQKSDNISSATSEQLSYHESAFPAARPNLDGSVDSEDGSSSNHTRPNTAGSLPPKDVPYTTHEKYTEHRRIFQRAATLLRESLQVDGGVTFLDTVAGFQDKERNLRTPEESDDDHDVSDGRMGASSSYKSISSDKSSRYANNIAEILGLSVSDPTSHHDGTAAGSKGFLPLDARALNNLMKYSRGKLWSFDEDGALSSSEDDFHRSSDPSAERQPGRKRKQAEAGILQGYFPGVRQLLFMPLWDAGLGRWFSGCFAWSKAPTVIWTKESELSFCAAFGNCVMAEVSKHETILADQQKGGFISSISHELRSPLHGILASAEFLGETECDAFQKSLVSTIDSCGRTLLDTINHVLDFSKINSFERNWRDSRKPRQGSARRAHTTSLNRALRGKAGGLPILSIYSLTNVAAAVEEVVEGVFAGQAFQDISSVDFNDATDRSRGPPSQRGLALPTDKVSKLVDEKGKVEVFIDIEMNDWMFVTQPGALRRVLMNLFGNAIKYTEEGWVRVKIELNGAEEITQSNEMDAGEGERTMVLTVTDTGKGISSDYLRTRLYTPFAQENALAPGTGLGLSLVRSIVDMLGGEIIIQSQVDMGTEVKVSLPLSRGFPKNESAVCTPSSVTSLSREEDDSISMLQEQGRGKTIALFGFDGGGGADSHSQSASIIGETLTKYITDWFGLTNISTWSTMSQADVVIADEVDMSALLANGIQHLGDSGGPLLVILCSNATRHRQTTVCAQGSGVFEFVSKPFGPYKLAKALRLGLDRQQDMRDGLTKATVAKDDKGDVLGALSVDAVVAKFEEVKIGDDNVTKRLLDDGIIVANEESANARMSLALDDGEKITDGADFPFPAIGAESPSPRDDLAKPSPTSAGPKRHTPNTNGFRTNASDRIAVVVEEGEEAVSPNTSPEHSSFQDCSEKRSPRILVVDDNRINLRLLETFMKKRKYTFVDSADNGQMAVERFAAHDIIFMDISMPIMNGFEATRAIRKLEEDRRFRQGEQALPPALIIALTGLASSRDQSEAFTSGVDLFLTKPVSFKEVGKLLDNWESNDGAKARSNLVLQGVTFA
ncbi:MAG: hypothetical protein M1827_006708 [Pycnora praestabilis]|nr:MAG: hypothetical protein M1827_006708 [Pycnora praestabilis]